jgi:hypothetical protein
MRGFRALVTLEWKRHQLWNPTAGRNGLLVWLGLVLLLVLTDLLAMSAAPSPARLLAGNAFLSLLGTVTVTWFVELIFVQTHVRDWWLCFPWRSGHLVTAKFVANLLVTARVMYTVLLSTALVWEVELLLHGGNTWQPSWDNFNWVWQSLVMMVLGWPVGVGVAALALVFSTGLWKGGHVLIGFVLGYLGALTGSTLVGGDIPSFAEVHTIQFVVFVIGWPVAFLCLIAASFGFRRLANVRHGGSQAVQQDQRNDPARAGKRLATLAEGRATPFRAWFHESPLAALYTLDFRRYMVFGRRVDPVVRRLVYAAMGVLTIAGFVAAHWPEPAVVFPMLWTDVSQVFLPMTVTQLLIGDLAKGAGQWWLAFPHSRTRLLVAKGFAALAASWIYTFVGLACIAVGFAAHAVLFALDSRVLHLSIEYLWRCALVCLVLNPVIVTVGYATSAFYRGIRQLLLIPAYFFGYGGLNFYISFWVNSRDTLAGPAPGFWPHLGVTALIGLPLAWICLRVGARNIHHLMTLRTIGMLNK